MHPRIPSDVETFSIETYQKFTYLRKSVTEVGWMMQVWKSLLNTFIFNYRHEAMYCLYTLPLLNLVKHGLFRVSLGAESFTEDYHSRDYMRLAEQKDQFGRDKIKGETIYRVDLHSTVTSVIDTTVFPSFLNR